MRLWLALTVLLLVGGCELPPERQAVSGSAANAVATAGPPACAEQSEADLEKQGWAANGEPVEIPSAFRRIVTSGRSVMAVEGLDDERLCIPLSWVSYIESMELFENGRYLGFEHSGYESFGYTLVDRVDGGREIRTGRRPHFSPDRQMVAGANLSDSGWGDLEGIEIWRLEHNRLTPLWSMAMGIDGASPPQLQNYFELTIVAWPSQNCILIDAKGSEPAERFKPMTYRLALVSADPQNWQLLPKSDPAVPGLCGNFAGQPSSSGASSPVL